MAVFELEPYSATDIAAYQSCYRTATPVTNVTVDGGPGTGAGSGEAALDIEDLIGLAPNASILVYSGKNSGSGAIDTYRAIVTQDRAKVISTSWGLCEPQEGRRPPARRTRCSRRPPSRARPSSPPPATTASRTASAAATPTPAVDDPASQPYVTGVGGTSLSDGRAPAL